MLSWSKVLTYVKMTLGAPNVVIERSDDELTLYYKMFTLLEFSKYVPDPHELVIDTTDSRVRTTETNTYQILDPDGCDIMNVEEYIRPLESYLLHGYPFAPFITPIEGIPGQVLEMEQAETSMMFSKSDATIKFFPPNRIRVYPADYVPEQFRIRYERVQPDTLMYIPTEHQTTFLYLALADTMIICGNIRNKYQSITTPFGDVPLNTNLAEGGKDIKDNIIATLSELPPNIMIHVG